MSVDEFRLLVDAGVFDRYAKTELIEGQVLVMNAQYRAHGMVKMDLYDALRDALRDLKSPYRPVIDFSLELNSDTLPEPDILLTDQPRGEGPVPLPSVALVIEVSDTTVRSDRGAKSRLYARAGIPEYWIADLESRTVSQLSEPRSGLYTVERHSPFGEPLTAATIADLTIITNGLI